MRDVGQQAWFRLRAAGVITVLVVAFAWTAAGTTRASVRQTDATPTATSTPAPNATNRAADNNQNNDQNGQPPQANLPGDDEGVVHDQHYGRSDPSNIVQIYNNTDGRMWIRGSIQLNRIPGPDVQPVNEAEAYSSCTGCSTIAVALQIDLVNRNATTVAPQNVAFAYNYQCSRCTTDAKALQYVIPVDDPKEVPDHVMQLIRAMDREMKGIERDSSETVAQAEARIDGVVNQFSDLAQFLYQQHDEHDD